MWILDQDSAVPHWRRQDTTAALLAFSTRAGGISSAPFATLNLGRSTADDPARVSENRSRLLRAVGAGQGGLVTAGQVHGARAVMVSSPGHVTECDALVTCTPNLVLAVTTADCMSLLLEGPGIIAAVHAGWRGVVAGVIESTFEVLLAKWGGSAAAIRAHLGPCIRGCCYEVGEEVAELFPESSLKRSTSRTRLDLPTAARERLHRLGLSASEVFDTGACTACDPASYFSHRRDQGLTGRHWALGMLHDVPQPK